MVYLFLAEGFEELEALNPIDILRRAEIPIKTVGVTSKNVIGAHGVKIESDIGIEDVNLKDITAVILPGGMPGTVNLEKSQKVQEILDYADRQNILICAICAAPSILGHKGFLKGKKATCFKGFEKELIGAVVTGEGVVRDGNIITSRGAGTAGDFAFEIVTYIKGETATAENLKKSMLYQEA